MEVRLTRPKTVAAALKPFQLALADLKAVLAIKKVEISQANEAIKAAQAAHDETVKLAGDRLEATTLAKTEIKDKAAAEIEQGETALGKISDILGLDTEDKTDEKE